MTQLQRTVLITGASSGIGKATARLLLCQGWKVIAAARTTESMSDLRESGAEVLPLDISDSHSRQQLARQINQQFGENPRTETKRCLESVQAKVSS